MTEATRGDVRADLAALTTLAQTSIELILRLQDESGAYPASPTFSAYAGYSWFRDGAFIADAMSAAGAVDSADRFFDWCAGILVSRRATIERVVAAAAVGEPVPDTGMLPARFTFDGRDGDDEWWDFQLDGYGTWLWAVAEHARRHSLGLDRWMPAIALTVDYLASSWQRPCFDWWEESSERVHVSTLGCIAAGLEAVGGAERVVADIRALIAAEGTVDGHLAKWLGSHEVDASLLSVIAPLGVVAASDPVGAATIAAVEAELSVDGGVHRYRADTFFGGGQWPLLSCFLGLAFEASGDRDRALDQLAWAAGTADAAGAMPEQVDGHLLDPAREQEWVDRWGPVARPLLWSHAMYIRLAVQLDVVDGRGA
ncbi:MAG: glucan 1,4-alpha-glucosidase [Microbacteriaceae bacterium]|nr:glucan 1,4-alpha-glucosidase [Microbacteriaceae bacterium]